MPDAAPDGERRLGLVAGRIGARDRDLVDPGGQREAERERAVRLGRARDRRPVGRVAGQQRRPRLRLALDRDRLAVDDRVVLGRGDGDLRRHVVEDVADDRRRIRLAARPDDRDREVVDALRQVDRDDRLGASAISTSGSRSAAGRGASGRS